MSIVLVTVALIGGALSAAAFSVDTAAASSFGAAASVATPTVTGPVTGGLGVPQPPNLNGFDLAQVGYQQSEYFLSGSASAYTPSQPLTSDGKWSVTASVSAKYTTRAVVYRPINAKKFNGTVIVEWLNVSGGVDANPDWTLTHNELVRDGFVWVGVSAQAAGVAALQTEDSVRYEPLMHPGDSFSYDIFSQAGQAVRKDSTLVLGGLRPRRIIAAGESQSASRLVTYIDGVHPLAHVYDGFLVHSRGATGSALSQPPLPNVPTPNPITIRNDLNVPVFEFETETDVFNSNTTDRQPDTNRFRLWEVAGSSHFDYYGLVIGPTDTGNGQGAVLNLAAEQNPPSTVPPGFTCDLPINTAGTHWVLNAAVFWLNLWVATGIAPPRAPYLQVTSTSPVVFAHDANGNVPGGVRSPQVDAPIATFGGVGNSGTGGVAAFCFLFGTTVPFSPSQLSALYKNHGQYVSQFGRAAEQDVKAGYLLAPDATELKNAAASSHIGKK